ncbi:50S ribosomal protein L17 [Mycoplasma zalophi]|uniref:Large ribosomal subunit protein bL17 n=1 Tax=Mycoplasma zalophi TaxID=191287 RepID=A0ABS6DQT4_9MOLU|nr:50S ribosomal protein L17 [Mycoplasma zalophi]MBU4691353.1 50S ribosomal protein L17 [Mycoplasma zalophi]MBU4692579.1 50S ribosomal protein L17 [Mycoplasma zalophi]MCU4117276.1 50S ribosomal protein L17 [Mycoplasma zalophi]
MANPVQLYRRNSEWRNHVERSLVTDVLVKGKVETTLARAKQLRRKVDKMITKAKKNTLASRRQVASYLRNIQATADKDAVQYVFDVLGPRYKDRNGGYCRIIKKGFRQGDGSEMAILQLV